MTESLFDPLAYIRFHGGAVRLEERRILVTFEWATRGRREKCQQLVAAGKIKIEGKRFRLVKDG